MATSVPRGTMSPEMKYENTEPKSLPSDHPMKDLEIQGEDEINRSDTKQSTVKNLGWLDRFLAVWIFLAMAIGIILGNFVENTGPALQKGKFVGVSIPISMFSFFLILFDIMEMKLIYLAIGLLVMMYPILCKVRYESLHHVFRDRGIWIQILFSIVLNWIVAPFLMVCTLVLGFLL